MKAICLIIFIITSVAMLTSVIVAIAFLFDAMLRKEPAQPNAYKALAATVIFAIICCCSIVACVALM